MTDPRTTEYNERGDVWQHTYAYHAQQLATAERSRDIVDMADRLEYRARITEAGDRKTAQLMREAATLINVLETMLIEMRTNRPPEGGA